MSNVRVNSGYFPEIDCYGDNPHNQVLIGVDVACENKTLRIAPDYEIFQGQVSELLEGNRSPFNR